MRRKCHPSEIQVIRRQVACVLDGCIAQTHTIGATLSDLTFPPLEEAITATMNEFGYET